MADVSNTELSRTQRKTPARKITMLTIQIDSTWKIESIEDTRQRGTDRKPILGSGDVRSCECCGKAIEVHATISNSIERLVIGTQCAKRHGLNYGFFGGPISPTNKSFWAVR